MSKVMDSVLKKLGVLKNKFFSKPTKTNLLKTDSIVVILNYAIEWTGLN